MKYDHVLAMETAIFSLPMIVIDSVRQMVKSGGQTAQQRLWINQMNDRYNGAPKPQIKLIVRRTRSLSGTFLSTRHLTIDHHFVHVILSSLPRLIAKTWRATAITPQSANLYHCWPAGGVAQSVPKQS